MWFRTKILINRHDEKDNPLTIFYRSQTYLSYHSGCYSLDRYCLSIYFEILLNSGKVNDRLLKSYSYMKFYFYKDPFFCKSDNNVYVGTSILFGNIYVLSLSPTLSTKLSQLVLSLWIPSCYLLFFLTLDT